MGEGKKWVLHHARLDRQTRELSVTLVEEKSGTWHLIHLPRSELLGADMTSMKCLTLWQPWATLVAISAKRIETRSWSTNYRGPLAIHAAKSKDGHLNARRNPFLYALTIGGYSEFEDLPFGMVLAVVDLVDVLPATDVRNVISRHELAFGDFSDGRYAWLLDSPRRLPGPRPARGKQGLWTWDYSSEGPAVQRMIRGGTSRDGNRDVDLCGSLVHIDGDHRRVAAVVRQAR